MKRLKRGRTAVFAALILSAVLALFAGCSGVGYKVDDRFPYDVAVENGYTGTEGEWLSSQETPGTVYRRMYEEAKADGSFSGTYFQFLQQLGLNGDATPYIQRALLSVVSVSAKFTTESSKVQSTGAGVIYRLDKEAGSAYIVTNYHVLYASAAQSLSQDVSVYLYGNETQSGAIPATYYGGDMAYDLAVLRVENSQTLRDSDALAATVGTTGSIIAGAEIYAIGDPLGKNISVTSGVISIEEEWVAVRAADDASNNMLPEIRIDAPVNHGNSGGGLFNATGELIGIVNARNTNSEAVGVGYAITIEFVSAFLENLMQNGGTPRPLHDGLDIAIGASKGVYDETLGRVHISQKLFVTDFNGGAGAYLHIKQGDTLISGYVERDGAKLAETQFTGLCAWEAFRYKVCLGDTLHLIVSRDSEQVHLTALLDQSLHFDN